MLEDCQKLPGVNAKSSSPSRYGCPGTYWQAFKVIWQPLPHSVWLKPFERPDLSSCSSSC